MADDRDDSAASKLRWMTDDRDRLAAEVESLRAEAEALTADRDRYREENHRLRDQVNQMTIQARLDRMSARAYVEGAEQARSRS